MTWEEEIPIPQLEMPDLKRLCLGGKVYELRLIDNYPRPEWAQDYVRNQISWAISDVKESYRSKIVEYLKRLEAPLLPAWSYDPEMDAEGIQVFAQDNLISFVLPFRYRPMMLYIEPQGEDDSYYLGEDLEPEECETYVIPKSYQDDLRRDDLKLWVSFRMDSTSLYSVTVRELGGKKFDHYHNSSPDDCWGPAVFEGKYPPTVDEILTIRKKAESVLHTVNLASLAEQYPKDMPDIVDIRRACLEDGTLAQDGCDQEGWRV